ncbi:hypothetical protein BYT27DRAFT_7117723, partial [Phlegmacium glaucopus]
LDADGYAVCPDCSTRINCGTIGLANLEKRHRGTKACNEARAKRDKGAKMKKNGSILSFLKHKVATVPLTVGSSAPIHSHKLGQIPPAEASPIIPINPTLGGVASRISQPVSEPTADNLISKLWRLVKSLPDSIPEASEFDKLAVFGGDPRNFDDPNIDADDLWETGLSKVLKATLGWGTEGDMDQIIRRGKWGLDGLVRFVAYFVEDRGVNEELFKGKLDYLIEELENR